MTITILPRTLSGEMTPPVSKSDAHRHLIASALSNGPTELAGLTHCEDVDTTIQCLRALGARVEGHTVYPIEHTPKTVVLGFYQSATSLRLLLPVVAALGVHARFVGDASLRARPLLPLVRALRSGGAVIRADGLPLTVQRGLAEGLFTLEGGISSQFVSGMLMALPLLESSSVLRLTSPLQSGGYVDMTLDTLSQYAISVFPRTNGYAVPGSQVYRSPGRVQLQTDWSGAAFFLAAGALGQGVTVSGLPAESLQPDQRIVPLLRQFGAEVAERPGEVTVGKAPLRGITVDVSQTPDLLPVLAVLGAAAEGETRLTNAGRTRLKESDRLSSVCAMLQDLGADCRLEGDALVIQGGAALRGGWVDGAGDHRIVMAAAIAAALCGEPVEISGTEAVAKSYPGFFEDYARLGGVYVVNDR